MLSRTADHLYWMARYIERAENMARVLDVTYNMSLVPNAAESEAALWLPALEISGNLEAYERDHEDFTAAQIIQYLALDINNPSSIYRALRSARENAHAVRVAMTTETWENINALWLEFGQFIGQDLAKNGLREFCDWVKARSHLFRGVCFGTMLRDDAFSFVRLGTFIERADNTARLLDVKYHLLLPEQEEVGGAVDYYEWSAVLRSVSAFQAYQKIYSDTIEPWRVAELLVLRRDMPRSLHACFDEITPILDQLSGSRPTECRRMAGELHAKLRFGKMHDIFQHGLHEFLDDFVKSNNKLGAEVHKTFFSIAT
ncbi:MAG TPA: alpha-E domain-containing protein [Methylophilaceae bacterium]|nr:alpha-E domain-containing protein [Methylophilaceae bacterium]HPX88302.1 alpha-E domain-containing protein [Methylophilaceae bacterium]HQC28265.1 alpha-E domain-containing protein [Methylotenera sp.]